MTHFQSTFRNSIAGTQLPKRQLTHRERQTVVANARARSYGGLTSSFRPTLVFLKLQISQRWCFLSDRQAYLSGGELAMERASYSVVRSVGRGHVGGSPSTPSGRASFLQTPQTLAEFIIHQGLTSSFKLYTNSHSLPLLC